MLLIPGRLLGAHFLIPHKAPSALLAHETNTALLTTEDGVPLA